MDTEDGNTEDHDYSIQTVGEGHMYFENCSTAWDEDEPTARVGVPVEIRGSIKNEGTLESRNYWEHIGTKPTTGDFKKYRLNVDGIEFSNSEAGGFTMAEAIQLDAPDLGRTGNATDGFEYSNLDSGNFAITGSQKDVEFGVEVGGKQNDDRPRGSRPAACRLDWLSEKQVVRGSIGGHCGYISH